MQGCSITVCAGSPKGAAMSDIEQMAEAIKNAMQAVDEAHEAGRKLREQATPETLDHFKSEMEVLSEHLQALKRVLNHEEGYFVEELSDLLSQFFSGKPAPYRSIPRLNDV
jgi:predicted transcriptional regulator